MTVPEILDLWSGEANIPDLITPPVYEQMKRQARRELGRLKAGGTLGTTALVHEAFVKLAEHGGACDERHAMATATVAMRQILLDHYRRRAAIKRGRDAERIPLEIAIESARDERREDQTVDILALEKALTGLASVDVRLARLVVLRFYGGLTLEEAGRCLEISTRTAKRDWQKARLMLWKALKDSQ